MDNGHKKLTALICLAALLAVTLILYWPVRAHDFGGDPLGRNQQSLVNHPDPAQYRDYAAAQEGPKAGQSIIYTVQRAGAEKQIAVTLARTPEEVFSSMAGAHMLESHAVMTTAAASTDANAAAASSKK